MLGQSCVRRCSTRDEPTTSTPLSFPTVFISTMSFNVGYKDAPAHPRRAEGDGQTCRDQEYVKDTYIQRGSGNTGGRQMSLVQRHHDDSTDSIEEVEREFPPGVG